LLNGVVQKLHIARVKGEDYGPVHGFAQYKAVLFLAGNLNCG
jgi:hypothetical protein